MKNGIKKKILDYLRLNIGGASIIDIAKTIGHNRLTVSKYLEVLRSEGKIDLTVIAQAKIWKLASLKKKVLVVDDEPHIVELIKLTLAEEDIQVMEAFSGLDALEKIYLDIPDLIILDIMMPGIGGFEVCQKIKSNDMTSAIPVIFLSAKAQLMDKFDGLDAGAEHYLVKPFDPGELRALVRSVLDSSRYMCRPFTDMNSKKDILVALDNLHDKMDVSMYLFRIKNFNYFRQRFGHNKFGEVNRLISNLFLHKMKDFKSQIVASGSIDQDIFCIVTKGKVDFVDGIISDFRNFMPFIYTGHNQSEIKRKLSLTVRKFIGSGMAEELAKCP